MVFDVFINKAQMDFQNWLYGEYDEDKLIQFQMLYAIPGVRQYMDYWLDQRNDREYMDRYGIKYSDITDPRKLRSTSSGAGYYGYAFRMVSNNVERLYR